jgi:hypothetical protein
MLGGAWLAADGRLFVSQPMDGTLLVIDPSGKIAGRWGRRGAGPGEMQSPSRIGPLDGGGVWVTDGVRIVRFDSVGRSAGTTTPSFATTLTIAGFPVAPELFIGDDDYIAAPRIPSHVRAINGDRHSALLWIRDGIGRVDTIALLDVANRTLAISDPNNPALHGLYMAQPFADHDLAEFDAVARMLVVARRAEGRSELVWHALDGRERVRRSIAAPWRRPDSRQVDSVTNAMVQEVLSSRSLGHARPSQARRWVRAALHVPRYQPVIQEIVAGSDGLLWVRIDCCVWQAHARHGLTGQIRLPPGERVVAAGAARVVTVSRDRDGVPFLTSYRLSR